MERTQRDRYPRGELGARFDRAMLAAPDAVITLRGRPAWVSDASASYLPGAADGRRQGSHRAQDDRHASVEQLSAPSITAIACLINRDRLVDIKPSFENDTNIVPMPPE